MRDTDPELADAAFDAVLFDREQAVPDLVECYDKAKKDTDLRFLCVQLLGFSGAKDAVPALVVALDDRSPRVRAEACRSLEDLGAAEAVPVLRRRLDDMDEDVRMAAAEALEEIRAGAR